MPNWLLTLLLVTTLLSAKAEARDEMIVRVFNNTNTRMLLGPTRVTSSINTTHAWKEDARYIEGGSNVKIINTLDFSHFNHQNGKDRKRGQPYEFRTPVYTQNIDQALAHYLSRQMPKKAKKDSAKLVGIASFYDTGLQSYRIAQSRTEKAISTSAVGLVTQEGFLYRKKPKQKASVALGLFVQAHTKMGRPTKNGKTPFARYAVMSETASNIKWLKANKYYRKSTIGYMYAKKQPGTVPMRMYHHQTNAAILFPGKKFPQARGGGLIHTTASKKLALKLIEDGFVKNKIQGYVYPYPDSQPLKPAVTPTMVLVQNLNVRDGKIYSNDLNMSSGLDKANIKSFCKECKGSGDCKSKPIKIKSCFTRWIAYKNAKRSFATDILEPGKRKSVLNVSATQTTSGVTGVTARVTYSIMRGKKPVLWSQHHPEAKKEGAQWACCSRGVKEKRPKSPQRRAALKKLGKSCSYHRYSNCFTRTVPRQRLSRSRSKKVNLNGPFRMFDPKGSPNGKSYRWMNSYLLSLVSAMTYEEDESWRKKNMANLGLIEFAFLDSQKLKTGEDQQWSVLHVPKVKKRKTPDQDRLVIIAIRGSTGPTSEAFNPFSAEEDWMTNFKSTPEYRKYANGLVHDGYADSLGSITSQFRKRKGVFEKLVLSKLKSGQYKKGQTLELWITGHSMGGAVAQQFAHWFAYHKRMYTKNPAKYAKSWLRFIRHFTLRGVVTFAAPMSHSIGYGGPGIKKDLKSVRSYAKLGLGKLSLRWENHMDVVPKLPSAGKVFSVGHHSLGYRAVGYTAWIDWPHDRVMASNPSKYYMASDHSIARHAERIYTLMPHKIRKRMGGGKQAYAGHPYYWIKPVKGKDSAGKRRVAPTGW
jgi:hypothetical protein